MQQLLCPHLDRLLVAAAELHYDEAISLSMFGFNQGQPSEERRADVSLAGTVSFAFSKFLGHLIQVKSQLCRSTGLHERWVDKFKREHPIEHSLLVEGKFNDLAQHLPVKTCKECREYRHLAKYVNWMLDPITYLNGSNAMIKISAERQPVHSSATSLILLRNVATNLCVIGTVPHCEENPDAAWEELALILCRLNMLPYPRKHTPLQTFLIAEMRKATNAPSKPAAANGKNPRRQKRDCTSLAIEELQGWNTSAILRGLSEQEDPNSVCIRVFEHWFRPEAARTGELAAIECWAWMNGLAPYPTMFFHTQSVKHGAELLELLNSIDCKHRYINQQLLNTSADCNPSLHVIAPLLVVVASDSSSNSNSNSNSNAAICTS